MDVEDYKDDSDYENDYFDYSEDEDDSSGIDDNYINIKSQNRNYDLPSSDEESEEFDDDEIDDI